MAYRRSSYVFRTEEDYNEARDHFYRAMYHDYTNSDALYFKGWWGSCSKFDWDSCYKIEIWSDCSDPVMAADIMREHRGRYFDE